MTTLAAFRTPPRILIPKLVRSRDAWKAKATTRKTQRKALEIRVRDLEASRRFQFPVEKRKFALAEYLYGSQD